MVMMVLSRRSSRPSRASGGTDWGMDPAGPAPPGGTPGGCRGRTAGRPRRSPGSWPGQRAAAGCPWETGPRRRSRSWTPPPAGPPPRRDRSSAPGWRGASCCLAGATAPGLLLQHPGHRLVGPLQDPDDPGPRCAPPPGSSSEGTASTLSPSQALPWPWGARTSRPAGPGALGAEKAKSPAGGLVDPQHFIFMRILQGIRSFHFCLSMPGRALLLSKKRPPEARKGRFSRVLLRAGTSQK